jgi:hypothetical protein
MKPPDQDLEARTPVWDSLQMLFMDTEPTDHHDHMVAVCASSPYTLDELEAIVLHELLPALRFNLMSTAGEWRGFETQWLVNRVLETHRFGKRHPYVLSAYAKEQWEALRPRIAARRG